jgi:iron-sulfur cluster assembly protein
MLQLTSAAAQQILSAATRGDAQGMALRVAARQVADGSIEYGMGFDEEREDDVTTAVDGLTVLVGSPSRPLLQGTVLDFVEVEPGHLDFVFIPGAAPARSACGTNPRAAASVDASAARSGCGGGGCGNCG